MALKLEDYMQWPEIEGLEYAECGEPDKVLGVRMADRSHALVTAYCPKADNVTVLVKDTGRKYKMKEMDRGYYAVFVPARKIPAYHLLVKTGKEQREIPDPYAVPSPIDGLDMNRFNNGMHYTVYEKLGAHPMTVDGVSGTYFALWAPNARSVSVVGDFNDWDNRTHPMRKLEDAGIYELFIPGVTEGQIYKYEIWNSVGQRVMKADPYGNYAEKRPSNASIVWDINRYEWQDGSWMSARRKWKYKKEPMLIYEVSLGSFRKPEIREGEDTPDLFYNYREIAEMLCRYCTEMGYTHVELMPVMEYPLDESWGYQVTGYYAATARYGTPDDFMYFVDYMHQHGIGVILDWVPAHFPRDEHGLARFDGTCLYEHMDPRQGEHPHWGTLIYNYGRPQVVNFLVANALFWLDKYHADGLRMDAVASMLYLDYGKEEGQWVPNMYGGHENLEAVSFLQTLNRQIHARKDGALTIAEESTAWPMVTGPEPDGLGFDLKWNMGWMNDFLEYMRTDPLFRKGRHNLLTFSMMYQYSEDFVLVISHDEVVHMKGSMYQKMPGTPEDKMASLRLSYGYMAAHPGKKLLFMGQEFGQEREWSEDRELDWDLLKPVDGTVSPNENLRHYVSCLNEFYRSHPAMYREDTRTAGFEWISVLDAEKSEVAFLRKTREEILLVLCNFTPVSYEKFRVGVPFAGKFKEIFNSDSLNFGGSGFVNPRLKQSKKIKWDGRANSIECRLAPLAVQIFQCSRAKTAKKRE